MPSIPLNVEETLQVLHLSHTELIRQMRLGRLLPRYRMGTGLIFDSYDVDAWARLWLNPDYVSVAQIARMVDLPRDKVQTRLAPFRDTLAVAKGDRESRVGALYDLTNPVLRHLFAQWGWDKRIEATYTKEDSKDDEQQKRYAAYRRPSGNKERRIDAQQTAERTDSARGNSAVEDWLLTVYRPRQIAARMANEALKRNERAGFGE